MKRAELIKKIKLMGCVFIRHGGKHVGIKTRQPEYLNPFHDTVKSLIV
jgi:hypothetical protein